MCGSCGLYIKWFDQNCLRDGHALIQINILNRVEQGDAFFHWSLEGFSAGD